MQSELIISANGLSRTFRSGRSWFGRNVRTETVAVKNISLSLFKGERVAFIGPNGAGKSTTIRILSGLLFPSAGAATVCGLVPWEQRQKLSYRIGCVFGHRSSLWHGVSVAQSFGLLKEIYGIEDTEYNSRFYRYVEAFNLTAYLQKDPRDLSLGERMRCNIAAALLHGPDLLFLDEPSLGLDIESRLALRELIRSICTEQGVTVLLTSHDTGDIEGVCDRVVVINHGSLIFDAPMTALRQKFMTEKLITIHTADAPTAVDIDGTTLRSISANQISLAVDTSRISVESAISALFQANKEISDVQVDEKPFEEVVRDLYRIGESQCV